jgi:O-antigen ligase
VGAGNLTYDYSSQPKQFTGEGAENNIYPIHNFPLQLAAQYGVPGLFLFGTTYLSLLWGLHKRNGFSRAQKDKSLQVVEVVRRSGWAFFISFFIISISVSYLFNRRPFYISFGMYLVVNQFLLKKDA